MKVIVAYVAGRVYNYVVKMRGTLAALVAALVLSLSFSAAVCDFSCALSQPASLSHSGSTCESAVATSASADTMRMSMPMQMAMPAAGDSMDAAHHAQSSALGKIELAPSTAPARTGSCQRQPCAQPATLYFQNISSSFHLGHAILAVLAYHHLENHLVATHHFEFEDSPPKLPALDPLSTNLRI